MDHFKLKRIIFLIESSFIIVYLIILNFVILQIVLSFNQAWFCHQNLNQIAQFNLEGLMA